MVTTKLLFKRGPGKIIFAERVRDGRRSLFFLPRRPSFPPRRGLDCQSRNCRPHCLRSSNYRASLGRQRGGCFNCILLRRNNNYIKETREHDASCWIFFLVAATVPLIRSLNENYYKERGNNKMESNCEASFSINAAAFLDWIIFRALMHFCGVRRREICFFFVF